jgi:biotin carboxylase
MMESILIFGVSDLQKSLIERCKAKGLFTVGIDPDPNAKYKDLVDAFEVVNGQDYDGTLHVIEKYKISAIITAATDKTLVMMARVAETMSFPFFSIETAEHATDKYLMKQRFQQYNVPCANGFILNHIDELSAKSFEYPVIVKPRDNSGSRGVIYCNNDDELKNAVKEALQFTKKSNVLVEEFIDGKEYSVEGIHYKDDTYIIQVTEKITSSLPYNVEMGHIQPADLEDLEKDEIKELVSKAAKALRFENCASHTELKISAKGIKIIETSPRLGGDFISSTLTPLSTGINMEDLLIDISLGSTLLPDFSTHKAQNFSSIMYFELPEGRFTGNLVFDELKGINGIYDYMFNLKPGDEVKKIRSSLDRYGYVIFQTNDKKDMLNFLDKIRLDLIMNR